MMVKECHSDAVIDAKMPKNKRKLCAICGREALEGLKYCELHKGKAEWWQQYPVKYHKKRGKRNTYKLRGDARWMRISAVYLANNYICVCCNARPATEVDHIYPVSRYPELKYTKSNFQALCRSCHQIKTARYEPRGIYPNWNTGDVDIEE